MMGKRRNSGKPWNPRATRDEDSSPSQRKNQSHPPHLKGKEIGLFYRNKGRAKRAETLLKPVGIPEKTQLIMNYCIINHLEIQHC